MPPETRSSAREVRRLTLGILLFTLLGTPLVAYVWATLNEVMSGRFDAPRVLLAALAAVLLAGLLVLLAARLRRWEADHASSPPPELRP